ncbi:MAG TPA: HAD family hydrolase [Ktedonobacterales bacterium]|jgi:putative hydrolase of the HAD superfamily
MMIFFDIGDTLVDESDFARFRHASVFKFLAQRGIATSEEQYTADLNNLSMRGRMTLFDQLRWFAQRGGGTTVQAMEVFRDYILRVAPEAPSRFTLFSDARECLERLASAHDAHGDPYRLGVIANQPTWIRRSLQEWGILNYFEPDALVISDEVAVSKPQPEIFQFALKQAGITPDEAVMVGNDYFNDVEPAKWLGMRTVWIERDDPYAPGAPPVQDPWATDARISSLSEIPEILARLERLPHANGVAKPLRRKSYAPKPRA